MSCARERRESIVSTLERKVKDPTDRPTIVIADPHAAMRQSLRHYLETAESMNVLAEVGELSRLASLLEWQRPQVALVSGAFGIGLPAFVRAIKRVPVLPTTDTRHSPAIVLYALPHDRETIVGLARAGADGLLAADVTARELAQAIRSVLRGQAVVSPRYGGILLQELQRWNIPQESRPGIRLTRRETQLLQLVASGLSNKEIAEVLSLAESTVKNRLSLLFDKIGVKDRTQAAIFALANGVLHQPLAVTQPPWVDA